MCMKLSVKDPGSALTHFIAMILAVLRHQTGHVYQGKRRYHH